VSCSVEGTQNALITRTVNGTVLAPSNPSWSPKSNQTARTVTASFGRDTGVQEIQVPLHNRGYTAAMARLDADGASAATAPFAIIDVTEANIAAAPANLRFSFNTAGLTPGDYTQSVTVWTSDENLPGAATRPLTLAFVVTVTGSSIPSDLNGDGFVNATDLAILLAQWGGNGPADIDGDGSVGGSDLAVLLASWTG
jgi:hypothetical protein